MQTLQNLGVDKVEPYARMVRYLDRHLQTIRQVVNHNAQEIAVNWTMETPANGTYSIWLPHTARKVIAVRAVTQAGTCTATVGQGASTISWVTAGGTGLSCSTTALSDTASTGNEFVVGTVVTIALSSVTGAAGLVVTLLTGT
jgi:hypothetical protein